MRATNCTDCGRFTRPDCFGCCPNCSPDHQADNTADRLPAPRDYMGRQWLTNADRNH